MKLSTDFLVDNIKKRILPTMKKVAKKVKKVVTKKKAPIPCAPCNATGLQDSKTHCPHCKGNGIV